MNNRAVTISLLFAILAVFFVQSYVSNIEEKAKKDFGDEVIVVTAKKDIHEMQTIDSEMFTLTPIPKRFVEPSALKFDKSDSDDQVRKDLNKMLSGAVAVVPIKEREQITLNKITDPGIRSGLSPQVTPGRRALAIPVNEVTGVAKLVKPGDRVDVIGVIDAGGGRDNKVVRTLLQDVVVLAVGRNVTNNVARVIETDSINGKTKARALTSFDGFASVTLEVEPVQAQLLALVVSNQNNTLILSLRNNDDTDRIAIAGMGMNDMLGTDSALLQRRAPGSK